MADEELSITIIPDEEANTAAATEQGVKKDDTATTKVEVKDPALQDLMQQYKDLETRAAEQERRRIEAEKEAGRQRSEAEAANKRATSSQIDTISTALAGAQEDAQRALSDIRTARAAGDIESELQAQDRLAKARATEMRLDEAKSDMEARAKAPPKRQEPSSDPVEAFCQGRTEPTARWIRAHPEYVTDPRRLLKLNAADSDAQAEGFAPDTPGYFAHVEKFLGLAKAEERVAPTEAAHVNGKDQPRRAAAPPVAPGSAVSSSNGGSSPTTRLNK